MTVVFCKDILTGYLPISKLEGWLLRFYNREWFAVHTPPPRAQTEHWLQPPAQGCHSYCIEARRPFRARDRSWYNSRKQWRRSANSSCPVRQTSPSHRQSPSRCHDVYDSQGNHKHSTDSTKLLRKAQPHPDHHVDHLLNNQGTDYQCQHHISAIPFLGWK